MTRSRVAILIAVLASVALLSPCRALAQSRPVVTPRVLSAEGKGWTFSFRYPELSVPGALMGVRGTMNDYNAHTRQIAQNMLKTFKKELADFGPPPPAFKGQKSVTDGKYEVLTNNGIVSVRFDVYQMMAGAAHPVSQIITTNWLAGGPFVKITDVFQAGGKGLQTVSEIATRNLQAQAKKADWEVISPEGTGPDPKNFEAFAIRKQGLQLYFQYAQVGPGAAGYLTTLVPWSALKGSLKPEVWSQIEKL